jgi:hypothetical protein
MECIWEWWEGIGGWQTNNMTKARTQWWLAPWQEPRKDRAFALWRTGQTEVCALRSLYIAFLLYYYTRSQLFVGKTFSLKNKPQNHSWADLSWVSEWLHSQDSTVVAPRSQLHAPCMMTCPALPSPDSTSRAGRSMPRQLLLSCVQGTRQCPRANSLFVVVDADARSRLQIHNNISED